MLLKFQSESITERTRSLIIAGQSFNKTRYAVLISGTERNLQELGEMVVKERENGLTSNENKQYGRQREENPNMKTTNQR